MTLNRQSALEHEKELSEAPWTRQDLIELGNSIVADSQNKKLVVATAMFLNGQRVFQMALDGTSAENDLWISYKVNTVKLTDCGRFSPNACKHALKSPNSMKLSSLGYR
jgi:uncharacterized protein (UPF0303 family)